MQKSCKPGINEACLSKLCASITTLPVAVICKVILYPSLSFGLRGQQSIHLHHKVAGPERNPAFNLTKRNTTERRYSKCNLVRIYRQQQREIKYLSSSIPNCWTLLLIRSPDVFRMMLSKSRKSSWLNTSSSSSGPMICQ